MEYQAIKQLKKRVYYCLEHFQDTRNSDILLTIVLWREYYPQFIKKGKDDHLGIHLKNLFDLPREDNIKRARAYWQNTKHKFLPTDWSVAKQRKILQNEWRVAMGYPINMVMPNDKPSWIPPSEIKDTPLNKMKISTQPKLFTPPTSYPDSFISQAEQAIDEVEMFNNQDH